MLPNKLLEGWMSKPELEWLYEKASHRQCIIEIGVWKGRSTAALCEATPGRVFAIEHWKGSKDERMTTHRAMQDLDGRREVFLAAMRNLHDYIDAGKLVVLTIPSVSALTFFLWQPDDFCIKPDMVFIDGGHDYESMNCDLAWRNLMQPDGLLCGHDLCPTFPGVKQALDKHRIDYKRGPGSIWYADKPY